MLFSFEKLFFGASRPDKNYEETMSKYKLHKSLNKSLSLFQHLIFFPISIILSSLPLWEALPYQGTIILA